MPIPPARQPVPVLSVPQFNLFDLNQDRRIDYHELKVRAQPVAARAPG